MSVSSEILPRALTATSPLQNVVGALAVNRSSVGALAFLLYDMLLTFDDEVMLIWPKPWTHTKFLYTFLRYFPALVEISILFIGTDYRYTSHQCYIWQVYQGVAAITLLAAVDFILMLRIQALYKGQRLITIFLAILFCAEIVSMSATLGVAIPRITYNDVCLVTSAPPILIIYGVASILFQGILFTLTIIKFLIAMREGWDDAPIVALLMRDGTWAFFLIFVVMVADASLYGLKNHALAGVLYGWLISVLSFSGYRILLNIQYLSSGQPRRSSRTTSDVLGSGQLLTTHVLQSGDPGSVFDNEFEFWALSTATSRVEI